MAHQDKCSRYIFGQSENPRKESGKHLGRVHGRCSIVESILESDKIRNQLLTSYAIWPIIKAF